MSSPGSSTHGRSDSLAISRPGLTQFPHISDLQAKAKGDLSQVTKFSLVRLKAKTNISAPSLIASKVDSLLDRAHDSNKQVSAYVGLKQPDRAYVEWIKSERLLELTAGHREFPYLSQHRNERYLLSRKVRYNTSSSKCSG